MLFNKVNLKKKYIKYSECKPGDVLVVGKYVETIPSVKYPANSNHDFKTETGEIVSLNSSGQLDYFLEEKLKFDKTKVVRITFAGKEEILKGPYKGKDKYGNPNTQNTFEFEVAEDDTESFAGVEGLKESVVANKETKSDLGLNLE